MEESEEHVDDIDEYIGAEHPLPEVPRIAHLGQEIEEEHGSTVRVDNGVDTLVSTEEPSPTRCIAVRGSATKRLDRNRAVGITGGEIRVTVWGTWAAEGP